VATPQYDRARKRLAQTVRRRREDLGLSQEAAAHAIHIATRHYQKLEAGSLNITLRTLTRVAEAFGVAIKDLFD
jgi:transcriptional regulator with XRE-family HTH domain